LFDFKDTKRGKGCLVIAPRMEEVTSCAMTGAEPMAQTNRRAKLARKTH